MTVVMPDGSRFGPTDMATVKAWVADGRVPLSASLLDEPSGQSQSVGDVPDLAAVAQQSRDPMSSVIPYRNGAALLSYYLGLFSLLACIPFVGLIGIVMAAVAVGAGVVGLRRATADPRAKGRVHCWIGLVCGSICGITGIIVNVVSLIAVLNP